ncbi:MAG: TlpA family protein disulfide reductase [Caldilineaceae bacterium]|nr:TlpA family protein disulfide reductase [Caldilineaceae bacterium]
MKQPNKRRAAAPARLTTIVVLAAVLMLAACGRSPAAPPAPTPSVRIDELPDGLGRGYPLGAVAGGGDETGIAVGKRAPNFQLTLDDGRALTLHDLQGRPVLINFWATWCGPCRLEMPEIVRAASTTPNLVVLAVNVQEQRPQIEAFAKDFAMEMPIVRDETGDVQNLYQIRGMPTTYFIDGDGIVRAVWAGVLTPDRLAKLLDEIM